MCALVVWWATLDCWSLSVVDSVTPVELVLSLSSLSAWRDSSTGRLLLQPSSAPVQRKEEPSESMCVCGWVRASSSHLPTYVLLSHEGAVKRKGSFVPDNLPEQGGPLEEATVEGGIDTGDPTNTHPPVAKGVLTLEKYSWHSVALGKQLLEVTTIASKGATLKLPAG